MARTGRETAKICTASRSHPSAMAPSSANRRLFDACSREELEVAGSPKIVSLGKVKAGRKLGLDDQTREGEDGAGGLVRLPAALRFRVRL